MEHFDSLMSGFVFDTRIEIEAVPRVAEDVTALESALVALGIDPSRAREGFRATHPFPVAVRLAALGCNLIPTHAQSKIPCIKKWQLRATTSPAALVQWQRKFNPNWSFATGRAHGLVALDIDGEEGRADLARLEIELGPLPATWRSKSGRANGGFHVFLRPPPGTDDLKNQQPIPGTKIDVRGYHGHIVIPGSLHKSGNRYAWEAGCSPDEVELAECPAAWCEWLPKKETVTVSTKRRSVRSVRTQPSDTKHDPRSCIIGDHAEGGGFNRPIRVRCCQFWARGGTDAHVAAFKACLQQAILNADTSNHTTEQVARYASDEYLSAELASAKEWISKQ